MNSKKLLELKKELMRPDWTESLHDALKELDLKDSKKIVESMTDTEIYSKVNIRTHQEDYIADYLEYLWDISKIAFWKHVKMTFNLEKGLLWSDNLYYLETMCRVSIPKDVLIAVIEFMIGCEDGDQDNDLLVCILKAQVELFDRLGEINEYINKLDLKKQVIADSKIQQLLQKKCDYLTL
jgi:hypothetical protein